MKFTSGVKHVLVEDVGRRTGADRPLAQPRDGQARPAQHRPLTRGSVFSGTAPVQPGTDARSRAPTRPHTLALLGVAASAALLGCSSLPTSGWRVEPVFRVEGASPNAVPGYMALAQQYEGEGRVQQALDAYHKAAQSSPDSADVQNTLGLALARHGRFEAAIIALRRAVALAPDRAPLLNNLAYALLLDGRSEEARAMLRLTLAIDPAHEIASRNLAHLNQQVPATASAAVRVVETPTRPEPLPDGAGAPLAALVDAPGTPTKVTTPLPQRDAFSIEILNGNGAGGAATRMRDLLSDQGIYVRRIANLPPYKTAQTQVLYRPGKAEEARMVVQRMPVDASVIPAPVGSTLADLRVVIGHDARHSAGCTALAVCAVAERTATGTDRQKLSRL